MDCVRTAVRQGAGEVRCVYRRDRQNMPGSQHEVENAIEEGVEFLFNTQVLAVNTEDDRVKTVRAVQTHLGEPDESGRQRPEPIADSEHDIAADAVIVAYGFKASPAPWFTSFDIDTNRWGLVEVGGSDLSFQTSNPKIFAAGDMVRGADLVVTAIADARKAAYGIVQFLGVSP